MSTVGNIKKEIVQVEWTKEEKSDIPPRYGCEILLENTSMELIKDPSFPSDAYIVIYEINGESHIDLCRGTRTHIFDLYYDKFGAGSVKKIDWGYGRVNPKLWGYKTVTKNKKRK